MEASGRKLKVLVADDDKTQCMILRVTLEADGYDVREAENGLDALKKLSQEPDIRLLLTDLAMPEMDGYELIKSLRQGELHYTYIIVLTSMEDRQSLLRALSLGADDYLTKPVFPDELKLRLKSGTRLIKLETQEELILSMAKLAEYRSEETGFHLERVSHYTRMAAMDISKHHPELDLTPIMANEISKVSPLHDIGKVAIPDNILHKPGKLDKEEWKVMKTHTTIGGQLLKNIYEKTNSNYLWLGYEVAMFHHERWDGNGYPRGLSGEDIPLSARIMAIADVYDALTSERCYKKAFTHETAMSIIVQDKGLHFDPKLVDSLLRQEEEWLYVKQQYRDLEVEKM
ncbi:MAG: response regulator [Desulfobacteraceae bacterium]|nr:response regulator [Desulfobacteraceae bacterium]